MEKPPKDLLNEQKDIGAKEIKKQKLEAFVLRTLEHHSKKINEGSKGIILKLDFSAFNKRDLIDLGLDIDQDKGSVFKILKIENSISADHEYLMHKRAYDILSDNENSENKIAKIPKVYFKDDINISKNKVVSDFLRKNSVNIGLSGEINIILMDYVDGKDFIVEIFEKIIEDIVSKKNYSVSPYFNNEEEYRYWLSIAPMKALARFIEETIDLNLGSDDDETRVYNVKLLAGYMKKNDILIEKELLDIIRNTVNILEENDLHHNDLHERNIMIERNEDVSIKDVYFIDWAEASDHKIPNIPNDHSVDSVWQEHTTSKNEKKSKGLVKFIDSFEKSFQLFKENKNIRLVERVNSIKYFIKNEFSENNFVAVLNYIEQQFQQDYQIELIIAFLNKIHRGELKKELVVKLVKEGLKTGKYVNSWKSFDCVLNRY